MSKVQRKVVRRKKNVNAPVGMILLASAGAIVVVAAVILVATGAFKPKTALANDPTGLSLCGNVPCPIKGEPDAPVTIIEVSDYGCSHCRTFNLETEPKLAEEYIKTGKVRFIVHSFGFSAETQAVAAAALCANDQGKFFEYHALLFENQGQFDASSLSLFAQQAGLDTAAFVACVGSGKHTNDVKVSSQAAVAAGVEGTPSFFVNNRMVTGALPFSSFQSMIDSALKSK